MWTLSKIPKIAHFYWHGSFLSWLRYCTLLTFQRQNPDWELRFYTPKEEHTGEADWEEHSKERTGVTGENYLDKVKDIPNTTCIELDFDDDEPDVYRSDLLRLKLLGEQGGLWLDMDVITFRPMNESILNDYFQKGSDTVISYSEARKHYSIGYMLASKGNEFFLDLYNKGKNDQEPPDWLKKKYGDRQRFGVILWDSFYPNPQAIAQQFPNLQIYNFQFKICYPYLYNDMDNLLLHDSPLDQDTIAIHWYGGHPVTRSWENRLTWDNYTDFNSTLCKAIRRGLQE